MPGKKTPKPARIGEYEPVECIGQGSMGTVWLCYDRSLDRHLVIKQMKVSLRGAAEMEERFHREVRVHARLQHPHIVNISAYWRDSSETLNLAMEWVNGWTLRQILDKQPRPPLWVSLEILRECLSALSYAHDRQIIHRDLKPSNLMLGFDGRVRLLDFGIAKDSGQDLTQTGGLVGTTAYMSPEQARALPLTPQSDLFSLGIIAWEMLGGTHPFRGESGEETLRRILNEPPRRLPEELPAKVHVWVRRLLEKNPQKRYPSARAASLALDAIMEGLPRDLSPYLAHWIHALRKNQEETATLPPWRKPKPVWLIAAITAIAGLIGGWFWRWVP